MRSRNIINVVVVLILLVSLISACAQGNGSGNGNEKAVNETASNVQNDAAENESGANNTASQPEPTEDKSPLTIKWFVAEEWYQKKWDAENTLLDKMITEDTGITVDVVSGSPDKLSAMIASGDLPDVVTVWSVLPQRGILEKSGLMAPLDEFIPKYAPDFKVPESIQAWYTQEDGHYYGLPNFSYPPERFRETDHIPEQLAMYARKDIMDQLGIKAEDFNSKEGTLEALRKVKDTKIQYNGFTVAPAYYDIFNLQQFFGGAREDAQGNYLDREREPETLEALKFMNQLYREGLMPMDSQTSKQDQVEEKVNAGSVFSYMSSHIISQAITDKDPEAVFVHVGPVLGDAGKRPYVDPSASIGGWTVTMMKKDTKHPERIIKFFEYMSSEDMIMNNYYGPRGIAWDFDENGKVKFTEQRVADYKADPAKAAKKYGTDSFPWFMDWLPIQRTMPLPTTEYEKAKRAADKYFGGFSYKTGGAFDKVMTVGGTEEAVIETKIKTLREQMHAKMVLAKSEAEVDKIWKDLIVQEDKSGYQKLYDYQNKIFKEAKKALGVEFAYPANYE